MPDVSDYELLKTEPAHVPTRRFTGLWIGAGVILGGALEALLWLVWHPRPAPATPVAANAEVPPAAVRPLGGDGDTVALPPLNETDPIVRELVKTISANPGIAAWLATDDLIRSFTMGVANVAQGQSAARQLAMLRPPSNFRVIVRADQIAIDPRTYARYDTIAAAAESLDPAATARLYATLRPRILEAARELGDSSFDRTLERAIATLLSTPTVNDPILVRSKGIGYAFVDPKIETLTAAQKHLIRTGPRNARTIQTSLRAIALALGIPAERLPGDPSRR
jgi:hypothetical protein